MDVNKNSYTFTFAAIMVVVVAALLSFAATQLQPLQEKNVELEKMQDILTTIGVQVERDQAGQMYDEYVKQELVLHNGQLIEGVDAFNINMAKEVKKAPAERYAPLYVAEKDGEQYYIIPLRGKGLWGPIWGYIALRGDANTVQGAIFDHKSETPGLGAEISTPIFMDDFLEKKILKDDGQFYGIKVMKGSAQGDYEVDGISGGTITSVGVEYMIEDCMQVYYPFLNEFAAGEAAPPVAPANDVKIDSLENY